MNNTYSIELDATAMADPKAVRALNDFLMEQQEVYATAACTLMDQLDISEACAVDVLYLRSRSRWTHELETTLIKLHALGTPPNVMEFGCTVETGQQLLQAALHSL